MTFSICFHFMLCVSRMNLPLSTAVRLFGFSGLFAHFLFRLLSRSSLLTTVRLFGFSRSSSSSDVSDKSSTFPKISDIKSSTSCVCHRPKAGVENEISFSLSINFWILFTAVIILTHCISYMNKGVKIFYLDQMEL